MGPRPPFIARGAGEPFFPAQQQIAVKAATQQRCVAQALAVLRGAPDLADAVSAGEMGLGKAYRALNARRHIRDRDDVLSVRYLKVAEVASVLRLAPMTVYRLIDDGKLKAIRPGARVIRIPEPALRDYLASQVTGQVAVTGDTAALNDLGQRLRLPGNNPQTPPPASSEHDWMFDAARQGARPEAIAETAGLSVPAVRRILREGAS